MKKYALYGIGAALVDTEISAKDEDLVALNIDKGLMTLVDERRQEEIVKHFDIQNQIFKRASGGSAANSIIAASYFGSSCFFTGKVADDSDGHFFLNDLANAGVDSISSDQLASGVTGKCLVLITPDAERSMNTFLGASETLCTQFINEEAAAQSSSVYIEGYLVTSDSGKKAASKLRNIALENQCAIAVSLSDPGIVEFFKDDLAAMFGSQIDMLFCNEDEALMWCDTTQLADAQEMLKTQVKQYAITLGAKGAIIWDGENTYHIDAVKVDAIDTNGAGDIFAGAYLHAIGQGYSAQQSGKFACMAAAKIVQQYGPRLPALAHQQLVDEFIASN